MSFTEFVFPDSGNSYRQRQRRVTPNSGEYPGSGKYIKKKRELIYFYFNILIPQHLSGSQTLHSGQTPALSEAADWAAC